MSIPPVGINIDCHSECTQCCPQSLQVWFCCCHASSSNDEQHACAEHKRESQPKIMHKKRAKRMRKKSFKSKKSEQKSMSDTARRSDQVAIKAVERHKKDDKPSVVCLPCVIV